MASKRRTELFQKASALFARLSPANAVRDAQVTLASPAKKDDSGIALFLVLSTVMVLATIVTEFTYVAQVNARLAFDSSDQLKAHYLALTGLKISLLRLKGYQTLKGMGGGGAAGAGMPQLPRQILDQIWKFPFSYPIPKEIPGISPVSRDEIEKFQTESELQGRFSAAIESESSRMNLNSVLAAFAAPAPTPKASRGPGDSQPAPPPDRTAPNPNPTQTPGAGKYDAKEAREGMKSFISNLINQKFLADQDFANEYRDLQVEELMDNILGWVDPAYTPKNASGKQVIPYKRAPFYSISELKMIYPIDDALYNLLSPQFTTMPTSGINVNAIEAPMLRAFFPDMTDIEVEEFFKFRDATDVDNTFKDADGFWAYMAKVGTVARKADDLRQKFLTQGVVFIVDEETFKITVTAEVNKAMRLIEAWVTLSKPDANAAAGAKKPPATPGAPPPVDDTGAAAKDATQGTGNNTPANIGLKIIFVRES